jgi:hypothetical protein
MRSAASTELEIALEYYSRRGGYAQGGIGWRCYGRRAMRIDQSTAEFIIIAV